MPEYSLAVNRPTMRGMHVVIAGGHGLLGSALTSRLVDGGHTVSVLTRTARHASDIAWDPADNDPTWRRHVAGADAVINLAGTSNAGSRWTAARKADILDSRVRATRALVGAVRDARQPPAAFLSGSAIGVYGPRGDEPVTEETAPGSGFLAGVCEAWEREAQSAATVTRVVLLRTGVVLARQGGALPQMALPFRCFAGGPVGSGRQWVSWIHIDDWVDEICWALTTTAVTGALNLTAPYPVTNRQFASTLGGVLARTALLPVPAFALRLALGEMAEMVLTGQRVLPARAQARGFGFRYADLTSALRALYP